jgi:sigma-B regulation protein RsbU (phosphoserine phosphatase)
MHDITRLLPVGTLVVNAKNEIVFLNQFGYDLLGYEPGLLTGKQVDSLLTVASRIYFQTHLYPLITLGKIANELYLTVRTQQNVQIPVLLNARWQEQSNDQALLYIGFIPVHQRSQYEKELLLAKHEAEQALLRNEELITLQRQLTEHKVELDRQISSLKQRNDELEQFSKIISHDLQEPLRKITLFTSLLKNESPDALTDMGKVALSALDKIVTRFRQLINDLQLYFTNTDYSNTVSSVDLTDIVRQLIREYDIPTIRFEVTELPVVVGNRQTLTSLFRHLLDNTVKFRKPGALATVVSINGTVVGHNSYRVTPDQYNYIDYARIIVSDNGIGFENHYREEVFRILKKLDPHSPGLGLGLSLSKRIVEQHNGFITAESAKGLGTTITVLLPIA